MSEALEHGSRSNASNRSNAKPACATCPAATRSTRIEAALGIAGREPSPRSPWAAASVEVAPAFCRVRGLAPFVRLGECVDLESEGRSQLGEVVRIDAGGVTVKPFEATLRVGLGTTPWRRGFVTLNPHVSWKGRTINALGEPIDGGGPLAQGARAVSTEREPPAPMRRQRVRTPVKTGVKVIDLFSPLCAGQRIGIFAGSGIGKSTLLGMLARSQGFDIDRHCAGRRARPGGARVHGGRAGPRPGTRGHRRGHGRREPDDAAAGAEDGHVDRRAFPRPRRTTCC